MKDIIQNKKLVSLYALWTLIHTYFLLSSDQLDKSDFWPFSDNPYSHSYDISEWLVYVFGPIVLIFLFQAFGEPQQNSEKNV
jgi:hypothetical protein